MFRTVGMVLASAILFAQSALAAPDAKRLALLIGNKGYTAKVGRLKNPHTDVELVAAALEKLGFTVTTIKDADYRKMDTAIKRYIVDVRRGGPDAIGFFYYSGHGAANPDTGVNYLIPVDVEDADSANVWTQSLEQGDVIDKLSRDAPQATHYVVFDACRNELNLTQGAKKVLGSEKGFVPYLTNAPVLIAFATAPRRTASDAGDGGGPYAKALAEELVKPGVEAVTMFRNVQLRVKQAIGQDPWLSFPTLPPVYLAGLPVAGVQPKPPAPPAPEHECDRLLADKVRHLARLSSSARSLFLGVPAKLDHARARSVCEEAVRQFPDERRFEYKVAHALWAGNAPDLARAKLEALAATGYSPAMAALGVMQIEGYFGAGSAVAPNPIEAITWLTKAAETGDPSAMALVGLIATSAGNPASAKVWLRKAEESGNPDAIALLGLMAYTGKPPNDAEALRLFRKAADAGNSLGMMGLALMHQEGRGVAKNEKEALRWLRNSAEAGEVSALQLVGNMHAEGRGTARDQAEAVRWYRRGAEAGDAAAMAQLGTAYDAGNGVAKDPAQAQRWYIKAAEGGDPWAQYEVARRYDQGLGVAVDGKAAARWMFKLLSAGDAEAHNEMMSNGAAWSVEFRRELQKHLKDAGLYAGAIDGLFGPGVRSAILKLTTEKLNLPLRP
jgi:TPR repeat protein/peptidoglycan hydrolase-like protein with peptidoglycan-binding domain